MDLRMHFLDTPELGERLVELGYEPRVRGKLTLAQITPRNAQKAAVAMLRSPSGTVRMLSAFAQFVWQAGTVNAAQYVATKLMKRIRRRGKPVDREQTGEAFNAAMDENSSCPRGEATRAGS